MPDHAYSSDPAVQAKLDRLWHLSPGADVLGLDRITRLLARLGDPHRALPPVFHVAGTNGKGSTFAPRWKRRGSAFMFTPARTSSASTSAFASPAG